MESGHALGGAWGFALSRFSKRLRQDTSGGPTVEFAIIAPAFIALLLAILHIALIYLAQEGLETAVEASSRLILTGAAQTLQLGSGTSAYTGMKAADFKTAVCSGISGKDSSGAAVTYPSSLPPFLTCNRLYVNVQVVPSTCTTPTIAAPTFTYTNGTLTSTGTGYGQSNCAGTTNTNGGISGTQKSLVIVQLIYLWPTVSAPLGLNFVNQANGNRMLVATSVVTVEGYLCATGVSSC
ncbi:TadE/TadG family type IV pilus assembly protein [Novosphingobium sediminicola]|uniref:TadE/TadG family type IV pilus assembly protein n=1 Tax=Novosphingobium sediminicola TaxID=563162 RepID=UPI0016186530|nr:TadE/TadG family type IV pilus assembly protein [Novosphingobium sediminicola]